MFFKKRETEIDDDFDMDENFDDFDLDDAGFSDATPKTGLRKAVSTVAGGFFSGLKSETLSPQVHRRILKDSLPDGYVAHYDDASEALREAKSIYNTASEEARKLKDEYVKELKPSVDLWNQTSNSKISNRISKIVASQQRDDSGHVEQLSESQVAFNNSANDIFGNTMAQATTDGIQSLNERTQQNNVVSQGLANRTNDILVNVSNSLAAQGAFNEQVALKWKKKTLEIQFKQYFTARKQLEVQTQSHEYLQATLPNIVKNTSLPDIVKTQTTELAGSVLKQKWIGDFAENSGLGINQYLVKASTSLKGLITDKARGAMAGSSMVGSALGMFDNSSGFGQSPKDMLLEALGGYAASQSVDFALNKSRDALKNAADGSDIDFEKGNEVAKQLKYQLPAIMASFNQNGTGIEALDRLLELTGLSGLGDARNTIVQKSVSGDKLDEAAVFNIETQRSITYTIPALLSEIHGELTSVRFAVGGDDPKDDDKLRIDWTSGRLNTNKRIRRNLEDKMYTQDKGDETRRVVYKMLGELGFDEAAIEKDREVTDKDGNVLLSAKDLNYLAVAVKTASFDPTRFFEIEDLANGSDLIRDETSRMNIAKFFTEQLDVDGSLDTLNGTIDIVTAKKNRTAQLTALKIKQQNIIDEARIKSSEAGHGEELIKNAVRDGNIIDLINQGIVTVDKNGNYSFDAQAHAEKVMLAEAPKSRSVKDMFGFEINNKYGADNRNRARLQREEEARLRAEEEKRIKEEAAEEKRKARESRTGSKASQLREDFTESAKKAKESLQRTREQIDEVKVKFGGTPKDDNEDHENETIPERIARHQRRIAKAKKDSQETVAQKIENWKRNKEERLSEDATTEADKTTDLIVGAVRNQVTGFVNIFTNALKGENGKLKAGVLGDQPLNMGGFNPAAFNNAEVVEGFKTASFKRYDKNQPDTKGKNRIKVKRKIYGPKARAKTKVGAEDNTPQPNNRIVVGSERQPQPTADGRIVVSNKAGADPTGLNEKQEQETGIIAALAANMVIDNQLGSDEEGGDKSNFFTGGRIGASSSLVKHFFKGGHIGSNKRYSKMLSKLFKQNPDLQGSGRKNAITQKVQGLLNPIKEAMDKETKAGGNAQLIVASENEHVLSANNGDAQAFRSLQRKGFWDQIKQSEATNDFSKLQFTAPTKESATLESDVKTIRGAFSNLASEVKKYSLDSTESFRRDFKDAYKDLKGDQVEFVGPQRPNALQRNVGRLKDINTDPLTTRLKGAGSSIATSTSALKNKFQWEEGEGPNLGLPSLPVSGGTKALSTISHQMAELIRITGHVAINTGSTADDLEPQNAELLTPFTVGRLSGVRERGGNFFNSLKGRFKRKEKEEGDEVQPSRWSRFKSKFKKERPDTELEEIMSDEPIDEETEEGRKKGLIRRMIGGMFGLSWGTTKAVGKGTWWATKKSAAAAWWTTKKTGQATAWTAKGLFGGVKATKDVYLEGERKPVMLARDMEAGKYLSAVDGKPILKPEDIEGAVLDEKGNFIITEDDYNNRRIVVKAKEGRDSVFVSLIKGSAKVSGAVIGGVFKGGFGLAKLPFKIANTKMNEKINTKSNGTIDKDIYVKGDTTPRILARLIGKEEYFDSELEDLKQYTQLKNGVYDKDANLILSPEEVKKGLTTPDGTLLSNLVEGGVKLVGGAISGGLKATGAIFKLGGRMVGGAFRLATGAGRGLWNSLKGESKDFDIDGIDKYALMLQAQAASVDKLEMIRVILDERMEDKREKFDDKDGDGHRDGSYLSQLRKKIEERKEKDAKKKQKEKEKAEANKAENDKKSMFSGMTDAITSGISGFFSKGLMFAALGGLVAANFGPQIATGIFTGIRSVLPWWLGGYSQEKKDEIAANGGIIKNMIAAGAAAREDKDGNRIGTQPQVDAEGNPLPQELDENGNPIPTEEGTGGSGLSFGTKAAIGAGLMWKGGSILKGAGKVAKGGAGLLGTGIRLASNKVGLTARMGLTGMGKAAAVKSIVTRGASGLGRGAMAGARGLGTGATALRGAVASHGIRGAAMTGLRALPALATTPVGLAVLGAVAIGVTVYAGYKLYKYLTREDNHLATFRMAQYGFKISDKKNVTKLLDLEQYLGKYTTKATASTSAKLSVQASTSEVLKIFGVSESNQEDVDNLMDWFYYRFKPVYLTWKTLFARAVGRVTIEDLDKMLYIEDKLKMIDDANFNRDQLNPYDTMMSPNPSDDQLGLDHEEVLAIKDKVIKALNKIDIDKHDAKVKSMGGGSKENDATGPSIDNMTASAETKNQGKQDLEKEVKQQKLKEKAERRNQETKERMEIAREQSGFSKFVFGDKEKKARGELGWGDKLTNKIKGFFGVGGGGNGGEGGTYDASSKTLNLSEQDIKDITKVTSTEAAEHLGQAEYNRQAGAIVDTIINRVISKGYPDTVRGVINQKNQFSQISGNRGAYGSVQNMPDSAVKAKAGAFVPGYLRGRVDGTIKPVINGDLNYLNPAHSGQKALRTWGKIIMDQANSSGQIYGSKGSLHYHGTSTEMLNKKPFGFKLAMGGKTSPSQGVAKKNTQQNGILGQSAQVTGGGNGGKYTGGKTTPPPKSIAKPTSGTSSAPRIAPGTGPLAPTGGAKATSIDLKMKSVTSKPGAGSTATGPSTWQKIKNFNSELNSALSGSPSAAPVTMKDGTKKNWTPQKKAADAASAEPKAAKPDGNLVAPEMTGTARPAKAVKYAMSRARGSSIGMCAKYVREALLHAGYSGMKAGNGCPSAYMYATTGHLVKNGFKEIPMSSAPQLGDVGVTAAPRGKVHGHIAIYNGSRWVSDFVHNHANPYSDKSLKGWLFRDAQFLDGAPVADSEGLFPGGEGSQNRIAPYQMKTEKTLELLAERRAKRDAALAKQKLKAFKEKEINIEFSGGRGAAMKDSKAESQAVDYKGGLPVHLKKLAESNLINYDTTPTGYVPKERVSKIVKIEDNGAVGNSVGTRRSADEIRAEHLKGEADRLASAKNAETVRLKAEKQNQDQLKRLEKARAAEAVTATEQKVVQEKQQKIAETDSGIYKQQLEVQISMARDIRRMAETLDKMYAMPTGAAAPAPTEPNSDADTPAAMPEMNTHTRVNAKDEPVSMKIR